jgi:Acetoacetate decarboxylase (ADC)
MQRSQPGGPAPIRRMPTVFGPGISPRQGPDARPFPPGASGAARRTVLSFLARSDKTGLRGLLPDRVELAGEPRVRVTVTWLEDVGWLAGRGYAVLSVQIPARVTSGPAGRPGAVKGEYAVVLWENLADPIITGREELGMAKVYAEISGLTRDGDRASCQASWGGVVFFEAGISGLVADPSCVGEQPAGVTINHKYMPRTGEWGTADVDYLTCSAGDEPDIVNGLERGVGRVVFHRASWQQLPTLSHIVNPLAALPLELTEATLATMNGSAAFRSQRIVEQQTCR